MKNNNLITIIIAIVIAIGGFFAGIEYQKKQAPNFQGKQFMRGNFTGQRATNFQGMRPVSGDIISQDDKSITVKMEDGSTKIVILSNKTMINKASTGSKKDLKTGIRVVVFGIENSDGSITAQNISLGQFLRGGWSN